MLPGALSAPNPWRCRVGRRRFVVLTVGGWHSRSALAPPPAFPYQYHHNGDERGPDKRGQGMESPTRGEEDEQPGGGVDDVFCVQGLIPPIACRLGWWARRCHGANVCVGGGALGPRTRVRASAGAARPGRRTLGCAPRSLRRPTAPAGHATRTSSLNTTDSSSASDARKPSWPSPTAS